MLTRPSDLPYVFISHVAGRVCGGVGHACGGTGHALSGGNLISQSIDNTAQAIRCWVLGGISSICFVCSTAAMLIRSNFSAVVIAVAAASADGGGGGDDGGGDK